MGHEAVSVADEIGDGRGGRGAQPRFDRSARRRLAGPVGLERALHLRTEASVSRTQVECGLDVVVTRGRAYRAADDRLDAGLRYSPRARSRPVAELPDRRRRRADLDRSHWDGAVASATHIVRDPRTAPLPRIVALAVVGPRSVSG